MNTIPIPNDSSFYQTLATLAGIVIILWILSAIKDRDL